tara:strand:- start:10385 stop:11548 length:1164 start_codon:yes stop_codon:yes gene_type:complete
MRHCRGAADRTSPFRRPTNNKKTGAITVKFAVNWLFGGQLILNPSKQGENEWSMRLQLNLNVTRFMQTNGLINWSRMGARNGWAVLRSGGPGSVEAARECLSGEDNFIASANVRQAIAADWSDVTEEYVQLVLRCIDRCMNQSTDANPGGIRTIDCLSWRMWSVGQAEVYWEAKADDAVSAVSEMSANVRSIAGSLDYREYNDSDLVSRTDKNSPSMNMKIAKHVRAAVYAKAHDRIRYEVRYDAAVRQVAGVQPGEADGDQLSNFSTFLDFLVDDAHERMSRVLPEINSKSMSGFDERAALVRILTAISYACGRDHLLSYRLISLLSNAGGVSVTQDDALFPVVEYLEKTRTLRRVHSRRREAVRRYVLSQPLRSAFAKLTDNRRG